MADEPKKENELDTEAEAGATENAESENTGHTTQTGFGSTLDEPAAKPAPVKKRSCLGTLFWMVLVTAMLGIAVIGTKPMWQPHAQPYIEAYLPEMPEIKLPDGWIRDSRVDGLTQRLKMLEAEAGRAKGAEARTGQIIEGLERQRMEMSQNLQSLLAKVEEQDKALGSVRELVDAVDPAIAGASAEIEKISARLAEVEQGGSQVKELVGRMAEVETRQKALADFAAETAAVVAAGPTEQPAPAPTPAPMPVPAPPAAQPIDAVDNATFTETVTGLGDKLAGLDTQVAGLDTQVAGLDARLGELEKIASDPAPAAAPMVMSSEGAALQALLLAVGQLRDAARTSAPFTSEIEALKALAGGDASVAEALGALESGAAGGIPSVEVLRTKFPETARAASQAVPVATGDGWIDQTVNKLASLVSVRRVGDAAAKEAGTSVDGILAQAGQLVDGGDLKGALQVLDKLGGEAAQSVEPWAAQARARLDAERALASLHVLAVSQLGAQPAPGAGPKE